MPDLSAPAVRRSMRALVLTPILVLPLVSAPAFAVPPETWPEPEPTGALDYLLLLVLIPFGLALVVSLLAVVPSLVGGQKSSRDEAWRTENEWFGGPKDGVEAIEGTEAGTAEKAASDRGGASGRW